MANWRMQLHPDDGAHSSYYTNQSLAAGFIGLDFAADIGDLERANSDNIPQHQKDYTLFAKQMQIGDQVLVISHHFPFAVCTVAGEYNYIKHPEPELGVWFRHFRRVNDVRLYADFVTNAQSWEQIRMTDTISSLVNTGTRSLELMNRMYAET